MKGIFLDTETNGLDCFKHRILEIAIELVNLTDGRVLNSYEAILKHPPEIWEQSDPQSLQVNGFTFDRLAEGISPEQASQEIITFFEKEQLIRGEAVYICQNPSFDRSFFSRLIPSDLQEQKSWPYHWLDLASMHWAVAMHHYHNNNTAPPWEIGISKDAIATFYQIPPEEKPHRAMNGVRHLIRCYQKIVGFTASS